MIKRKHLSVAAIVLVLIVSSSFAPVKKDTKKVKNIILMIGDGMGMTQMYAAYTVNNSWLNMLTMPFIGMSKTNSIDDYITDSAAGGTALSCGKKTKNGSLAVDSAGHAIKTILEYAEEKGYATGLVSTSAITHATPASFIAHIVSRNDYEDIAAEFLKTDFEVIIGGGKDHFAKRKDNRDLTKEFEKKGYKLAYSIADAMKVTDGKLVALTAAEHNPKMTEGRGDMLTQAVNTSISILSQNKNGFFLMAEGSMIDWGNHANNQEYTITETIDFDKAVGAALEFARKDGNTLVIVIADHESGGMTLIGGDLAKHKVDAHYSTKGHSAVPVPVYAFGPGAEMFTGFYENTAVFDKMMQLYGFSK